MKEGKIRITEGHRAMFGKRRRYTSAKPDGTGRPRKQKPKTLTRAQMVKRSRRINRR